MSTVLEESEQSIVQREIVELGKKQIVRSENMERILTENGVEMVLTRSDSPKGLYSVCRVRTAEGKPRKINLVFRGFSRNSPSDYKIEDPSNFTIKGTYVEGSRDYQIYDNLLRTLWRTNSNGNTN